MIKQLRIYNVDCFPYLFCKEHIYYIFHINAVGDKG